MARNLRKGSKVCWNNSKGVVLKRFTVRRGSVNVDPRNPEARTLVHVRLKGGRTVFSKRPSELKRCKFKK